MAQLKIEKTGPPLFSFQIQWKVGDTLRKQSLAFTKKGECVRELAPGTYALGWALTGDPGSDYNFKVTLDVALVEERAQTVPPERVVGGALLVEVP